MSLTQVGVRSLLAVNSWIGVINSNLQGASRIGYKTVRPHLTDGLGYLYSDNQVQTPTATLNISATSMEWAQGSIINSEQSSHFALQGEGFFVLADSAGRYYLTRDGEFHWDGNGYLVNSAGLYVISSGQDFIRKDRRDRSDGFDPSGISQELLRYGDKSLLIADVSNRDGLRMTQYGSTVFGIDGNLPLRVRNDFSETSDGLSFVYDDPLQLPTVDDPNWVPFIAVPPPGYSSDFGIDFGDNGVFNFSTFNGAVDFNPNANTIQNVVDAINAYGGTVGGRVSAYFDTGSDQLIIRNEQDILGGIVNTQVVFLGANGLPMRKFFQFDQNQASDPFDDIDGDTNLETVLSSHQDIDNSRFRAVLDIAPIDLNATVQSLSLGPVHPATYFHDKPNGFVQSDATAGGSGVMVIGESQQTGHFDVEVDLKASAGVVVFGFGQSESHKINSSGFALIYNTATGVVTLQQRPPDANGTTVTLQTSALPVIASAGVPPTGADPLHRMVVSMDENQILTMSVDGAVVSFNLGGASNEISGYLSLRNAQNFLQVHNLRADFHQPYNVVRTGEIVSRSPTNYSSPEVVEGWQERQRTRIVQSALESSTASLTEYIPMLALAQKVFASISKIITAQNTMIDDINSTLR
jgi:flagellar basal body rod protein FlgG